MRTDALASAMMSQQAALQLLQLSVAGQQVANSNTNNIGLVDVKAISQARAVVDGSIDVRI
jgi:hypothetical protein